MRFIAELGSCHMGKLDRIQEAADRCKAAGIDALKLQLFPNEEKYTEVGNVWLNPQIFVQAFHYGKDIGVSISASVFDLESFGFLLDLKPDFIKFSYSKKDSFNWIGETIENGIEAIVSCDVMSQDHPILANPLVTKLYCIPEYPVRYEVAFDGLFDTNVPGNGEFVPVEGSSILMRETCPPSIVKGRFDGFSDHTLGVRQTRRAIEAGAQIIEKHVRLGDDEDLQCPDGRFAVMIEEFGSVRV